MGAQIRYLAIVSERPEVLAEFYSRYFSLRELGRSDAGDVALTDGFYNISLLKPRHGASELGISHLGIAIDNIEDIEARIKRFAPGTAIREEQGGLFYGDYQVTDPYGQVVSLSTHQFHTPSVERAFPCIRHIATCVHNNDEVLDFMSTSLASANRPPAGASGRRTAWCAGPRTAKPRWPSWRTAPVAT